jgi:signal transduction histidine kinase
VRKAAILFVLAVLLPSLVLAWLAFRSLRDQELISERQRDLLCEGIAVSVVKDVVEIITEQQTLFGQRVEMLLGKFRQNDAATRMDEFMPAMLPVAKTGFAISSDGQLLAPSLLGRPSARRFRLQHERFLTSKESAQVYWEGPKGQVNLSALDAAPEKGSKSKPVSAEADFRQLVGDRTQGTVARFAGNELSLMFWYRPPRQPETIFGIEVDLAKLGDLLKEAVRTSLPAGMRVAILNENTQPVAVSDSAFQTDWRQSFESVEIGDLLPHWKVGVYLLNPKQLSAAVNTVKLTLSLSIALSLLSIFVGGWLIFRDLQRELRQARLRTDFVSNVSHELKTPLTSIRMFSELLVEGRVDDESKRREYLRVIVTEAARLTRLISNVLDFARMERGDKPYRFQRTDIVGVTRETLDAYRPQLEASGFVVELISPAGPIYAWADRDTISQVLLNLLSNAEKYSSDQKKVRVILEGVSGQIRLTVEDRGRGVPPGCEQKIFEQFFRAHDSLSDAIPGAGLGLAVATQIARSHKGKLWHEHRTGGGSRFVLEIPQLDSHENPGHRG